MPIYNSKIELPSGLWIVATPIGNLYDLTARACEALKRADLVLCEDTRRTLILLKYLNLSKQLVRFDAHSNSYKLCKIIDVLQQGKNIALVTDAGTPCISDPGANLVNEAHKAGILVTPVAGVSALSTFLSVSGIHENGFCFRGFFPRKPSEQQKELKQVSESLFCHFYVWFESPQRIEKTIETITFFSPLAEVVVAKELTKFHEKLFYGSVENVFNELKQEIKREGTIGEWCFGAKFVNKISSTENNLNWVKTLDCLLKTELSLSLTVKNVSQYFGISKNTVYEMALKLKNEKK